MFYVLPRTLSLVQSACLVDRQINRCCEFVEHVLYVLAAALAGRNERQSSG